MGFFKTKNKLDLKKNDTQASLVSNLNSESEANKSVKTDDTQSGPISNDLKEYSFQILDLADTVLRYYDKKNKIKSHIQKYKNYLNQNKISKEQYNSYVSSFLRGNEEFKVYDMYDNYIRSQVEKMKSFSDGIFNMLENMTFNVEIDIEALKHAEEEKLQKEKEAQETADKVKSTKKKVVIKEKPKVLDASWKSGADKFVKRQKKEPFFDKITKSISLLMDSSVKKEKKQSAIESDTDKVSVGAKFGVVASAIFGSKKKKSVFDKDRKIRNKRIDQFIAKHQKKDDILGQKTVLSDKFKNLRRIKIESEEENMEFGLMSEHTKSKIGLDSVAKRASANQNVSYSAESYSALANILMKDLSLEFINSFPEFFKGLYKSLRLANIKVLSSSYTNMMILSSFIGFVGGMFLLSIVSIIALMPFPMVLANSLLGGILGFAGTFVFYYLYPTYMLKKRDRDIRSNIPFAIDHMAAIVGAGVSPTAMFDLISQSKDYGEVSVELEKVVEYVELFGYDLLTAVKSVSVLTPSKSMKEFLEGFQSSIESGGDLKNYLREQANASMLQYKLERQRYTESVSTFSDIYTGIMVASPLFFVAVLSLVSILGGSVGGMDITTVMLLGTYLAIPLLNVFFMVFMEFTQPDL